MNGLIQNAVNERSIALVQPANTQTVDFRLCTEDGTGEKLARYYAELGREDDEVPVYKATVGLGGSTYFEVHTGIEELDTTTDRIYGIIIYAHDLNVCFEKDSTGEPPVCVSMDGVTGHDRLTGETCDCEDCPRNCANKGERKECRNKKRLYILTEGTPVPLVIDLPPTSLKAWKTYTKSLNHLGFLRPHEVLTEFTLESAVNANKIKYSRVKIKASGRLKPEMAEQIEWIRKLFKPLETVEVAEFEVMEEDNGD